MSNVLFLNESAGKSGDRHLDDSYLVCRVDDTTDGSTVVFRAGDRGQAARLCGWLNGAVAER